MQFNDWQIDKLRRGLHAYRALKAKNNRLPAWKDVLDAILLSPVTAHEYAYSGDEPEFKEEALRRFAAGSSVLQSDKLSDVRRFLVGAGVFTNEEFAEDHDKIGEAAAIHARLANVSQSSVACLRSLEQVYRAESRHDPEKIELRFFLDVSGTLLRVEEQCRSVWPDGGFYAELVRKDNYVVSSFIRKGYGFSMTPHNALNIFVRGEDKTDTIHYVRVGPRTNRESDDDGLYFVRCGGSSSFFFADDPVDSVLRDFGIVRFVPVRATR